jgi:2-(1,2-epoxy-1,2-dihydrophenyl)acetyl-CoA isomerase
VKVKTTIEDGIATIVIDRPEVRNAIDLDTVAGLRGAFEEAASAGVGAAVLAGGGNVFCAGADLAFVRKALEGDATSVLGPLVDTLHGLLKWMRTLPFPIVASIEGAAAGAGMGLALAADTRIAGTSAVFVTAYFGIGASPDGGVSYHLTRSVGAARATELVMSNRPLRAQELLSLGLVERVVDDGQALAAARGRARELASIPPLALVRLRALVDAAPTHGIDDHLDAEREAIATLWQTEDFREGISAFLERRSPQFTGR